MKKKFLAGSVAAGAILFAAGASAQVSDDVIKIGVLNDQSSIYADAAGKGSVELARMAAADWGGKLLGKPVETYYSPAAFDQGYLNHVGIPTANFGAGEHQYAHTDFDMASVERTTDSARVYAFVMLDYLT